MNNSREQILWQRESYFSLATIFSTLYSWKTKNVHMALLWNNMQLSTASSGGGGTYESTQMKS